MPQNALTNPAFYDNVRMFIQWADGVDLKNPVLVVLGNEIEAIEHKTKPIFKAHPPA